MITDHPSFPAPRDRDLSLWRYMDLSKFVWMLQQRALYFCRFDALGDPYEGHYTRPMLNQEDDFVRDWEAIVRPHLKESDILSEMEETARKGYQMMLKSTQHEKLKLYVSCWHGNTKESDAMWRLYTTQGESISIRTTFNSLADELPPICMMGSVSYIDYDTSSINVGNSLNYVMHKRDSFQHEREVRAVVWMPFAENTMPPITTNGGKGAVIPINLEKVIKDVFVSPTSDAMLLEVVQSLCKTYGLTNIVQQSTARTPPNY